MSFMLLMQNIPSDAHNGLQLEFTAVALPALPAFLFVLEKFMFNFSSVFFVCSNADVVC